MKFKAIRTSRFSKVLVTYLSLQLVLTTFQPATLWALTGGPSQPEFSSFTPIGTSDMVDLASGDLNYNIPIMDVGGYPLNLSYNTGITMDQEASWVGLGWNLNVGHIDRNVRGIPDDFNGDIMNYENYFKPNTTVGASFNFSTGLFGAETLAVNSNFGLTALYNNYEGVSFVAQSGVGFQIADNLRVSADFSSSVSEGASVSPSMSLGTKLKNTLDARIGGGINLNYNSREGLKNFGLQATISEPKSASSLGYSYSFSDPTFTPTRRVGLDNTTFSFYASLGSTIFGPDFQGRIEGFGSIQEVAKDDRDKFISAYGYENTEAGVGENSILDFNRAKEGTYNKHTTAIPVTNYTYDLYSINAQGLNASFRPFKSQVGYVHEPEVSDVSNGYSLGARFAGGAYAFIGGEIEVLNSSNKTGNWQNKNNAIGKFSDNSLENSNLKYEPTYFKIFNEITQDPEENSLFQQQLHGEKPMNLEISGNKFNHTLAAAFLVGNYNVEVPDQVQTRVPITSRNFTRKERVPRRQNVYKVTNDEAIYDNFVEERNEAFAKDHHTVGIKVLKTDGSEYVFGKSVYNQTKIENTFDVSKADEEIDWGTGLVQLNGIEGHHSKASDQFLNKVTTPAYSHSYLLSHVLSPDYEDIDGNGPSINDLGAYTTFNYKSYNNLLNPFRWRLPYHENQFYYDEGLKTEKHDEKASYIYGEKELTYISTIETKTHVAFFELENREDARGAKGELSIESTPAYSKRIKRIYLFSRPEYEEYRGLLEDNNSLNDPSHANLSEKAIKIAHFEYDYSLVQGVPNNLSGGGKLTLKKVYFTFRDSNMGKFMPYLFNYDNINPDYSPKSYDVWGNFKPFSEDLVQTDVDGNVFINNPTNIPGGVEAPLTAQEFPYTLQTDRDLQNIFSSAWTLSSIDLPSGGRMELEYESDDYNYVQDKRAMRMFNAVGAGNNPVPTGQFQNNLYTGKNHNKYIYVKIKEEPSDASTVSTLKNSFSEDYLNGNTTDPIQFTFLLNMVKNSPQKYDYVTGYLELEEQGIEIFSDTEGTYASIPIKFLDNEGGLIKSSYQVNPITKAGWYFGRTFLNREVYSLGGSGYTGDTSRIIKELIGSLSSVLEIFAGPNTKLQEKNCARYFIPEKSWIRLFSPDTKLGGGLRVKEVTMHDNWDLMTGKDGNEFYAQHYGQQYLYTADDGKSSGVAAFEPQMSRENPFIQPFYDDPTTGNDKLVAPPEFNYKEKPFGEAFFPSARITYSKVKVQNLERELLGQDGTVSTTLKKHGTGHIEYEFYTTKDFPTKVELTPMDKEFHDNSNSGGALSQILDFSIRAKSHLTLSQGFSIITNDMDGKPKSQFIFSEGKEAFISSVQYDYNLNENNEIETHLPVLDHLGEINSQNSLGMYYDITNDFQESKSKLNLEGVDVNLTIIPSVFLGLPFPVPLIRPKFFEHEMILRTAATTKLIHQSGILKEKIVSDLGSNVSTENLVWDPQTGNELLVKTNNEFDDFYFNFRFPSYWAYRHMGQASQNIGITGILSPATGGFFRITGRSGSLEDILVEGDELLVESSDGFINRFWVLSYNSTGSGVRLIDRSGYIVDPCSDEGIDYNFKIVRSGFRNLAQSTMASITSVINPVDYNEDGNLENLQPSSFFFLTETDRDPRILSANAVQYKGFWRPQTEKQMPFYPEDVNEHGEFTEGYHYNLNPFIHNIRGDWRPNRSYAYLTSRKNKETISTRHDGFYSDFLPFYSLNNGEWLTTGLSGGSNWTFASEVTQHSPYGAELENRDALGRYSSAQYGYNYTLPTAVASNSEYREIGFDGFEDYSFSQENVYSHFSLKQAVEENSNVSRTTGRSHTGLYSIQVVGNSSADFSSSLEKKVVESFEIDCSATGTTPSIGSLSPKCRYNNCNDNSSCSILFEIPYSNLDPSRSYSTNVIQSSSDATVSLGAFTSSGGTAIQELIYHENNGFGSVNFTIELYDGSQLVTTANYNLSHSSYMAQLPECSIGDPGGTESFTLTVTSPYQVNGNCYTQMSRITNGNPNQFIPYFGSGNTTGTSPTTIIYVNGGTARGNFTLDANGELDIEFTVCSDGETGVFNLEVGDQVLPPLKWN